MSTTYTPAQIAAALKALGITPEGAPAKGRSRKAGKASAKPNRFYTEVIASRVPCAYGSASCKGRTFAPNGVGSKQHTSCKKGLAALAAK
jgi:hypothetical protein